MKIQSIIVLFNIILIVFIGIICIFPTLFLGSEIIAFLWRYNWFLLIIFIALLSLFNFFYLVNRKLYGLLEKEDWPALIHYLEDKILRRGRYTKRLVRLLANSYIILSDSTAVMNLENKTIMVKPSLVDDNALIFGIARILGKDYSGAMRFFGSRLGTVKQGSRQWVRWYFAFSLVLNNQFEMAFDEFSRLVKTSNDKIIIGISSFFMVDTIVKTLPARKLASESIADEGREKVLKVLTKKEDWERELSRINTEIHALVISKTLAEAGEWLYT